MREKNCCCKLNAYILLEPKVISLCHQYKVRIYSVRWLISSTHFIILNLEMCPKDTDAHTFQPLSQNKKIQTDKANLYTSPLRYSTALTIFSKSANHRDFFKGGLSPWCRHDSCDFPLVTWMGEICAAGYRHRRMLRNFALLGDHYLIHYKRALFTRKFYNVCRK